MMEVVLSMAKDICSLKDLDLKTYHYQIDDNGWKYAFSDDGCVVYTIKISRTHIGFMITQPHRHNLRIVRMGVRKRYRGLGAGKKLLQKAEEMQVVTMAHKLEAEVPEIHCLPGDPDDVSMWLKFQGFRATRVRADAFPMYGNLYDGILFER